MNNVIGLIALAAAATLYSGCGRLVSLEDVSGTSWAISCGVGAGFGAGGATKYSMSFTSTRLTASTGFYDQAASSTKTECQVEDARISVVYDYRISGDTVGAELGGHPNVRPLDLTLRSINVLPVTSDGITYLNTNYPCGQTYTVGTSVDVLAASTATTANCANLFTNASYPGYFGPRNTNTSTGATAKLEAGAITYQVLEISSYGASGKVLLLGNLDGSLADGVVTTRRPTAMNVNYVWVKQ